jgi:hypothetical protein
MNENVSKFGSITEYQSKYHNIKSKQIDRPVQIKIKDTLSFDNKRQISDPPYIFNNINNFNGEMISNDNVFSNHSFRR